MARATYDEALRRLLVHEGGYSNHPSDPGGPTTFGITIRDYRKYVKPDANAADVRAMPLDAAKAIYRAKYWNALRCDELPAGLDYCVFDYGVNSGVSRSAKVLQRMLSLKADGRMSDAAIAAARRKSTATLINRICDDRMAFLKRLKTWRVFGKGWSRRVAEVRAASLAMAKGEVRAAPSATPVERNARAAPEPIVRTGFRDRLKGWRTILFGAAIAAAGTALDLLDAMRAVDITPLLPAAYAVKIIAAIGIVTILLRLITTGRVGQKDR